MEKSIIKLIKYLRKEDIILFIGSGFSLKAGAPSVQKIIEVLNKEAGTDLSKETESQTLRNITEKFVNEYGDRNEIISILQKLFSFTPSDTNNQKLLARIPHIHTIFTTNYDTLIEDAYPKEERTVITNNKSCAYDNTSVCVYKVHGDISSMNDPDNIVITDSDYKGYFKNENFNLIWEHLKLSFVKKHVVFIGYSLEDDNILDIIKTVRDCIGNNMKQLFIIAPGFNAEKKTRLKANNIEYIDSKADKILEDIIIALKDNIVSDFRQKKINKETFDKFCELNAELYATTTSIGKENRIDKIHVKEGFQRNELINFTIPNEIKENIENKKYNDRINLTGTNLYVPAFKISSNDMIDLEYRINGILISSKNEVSNLLVAPSYQEMKVRLKMPYIGFIETVKACRYVQDKISHIDMDTPICILKMIVRFGEKKSLKINIKADFKKNYNNNNEAIRWIQFLIGLSNKKKFFIDKMEIKGDVDNMDAITEYRKYEEYYTMIKSIECNSDVVFDHYDNYSTNNYLHAKYLQNYQNGTNFETSLPQNATVTFAIDTRKECNESIDKYRNDEFVMVQCDPLGTFELNGIQFFIPYKTTIFQHCFAKKINPIDKYNYEIVMQDKMTSYITWCTDTEPVQEGNILHLGNPNAKIDAANILSQL